jgi:hypothetical protein
VPWVETHSLSFSARHGSADASAAEVLLDRLEAFRGRLEERFPIAAGGVAVVVHPRAAQLDLAAPWLPLARAATAPGSRRYVAGWFTRAKIHTLSPRALEDRASAVPGSREALGLAPLHEYVHVVVGANCPGLPPPFGPASFVRYLRLAWLCEGAATHFSGQSRLLRGAVARRLREGSSPSFPPSAADALLLGGTVFDLLEDEGRGDGCVELATRLEVGGSKRAIERAFGRPLREVEHDWRERLAAFAAA